ncbi:hypothetical protein [Haloechinothrix halophila]|uniref:hypothetical protein n=1 Tax=Haloechinothrix halophila TaxID=1069073 RepID=UPI00042A44B3|nr:hypothetical protein [Haloechinothrix halophila]
MRKTNGSSVADLARKRQDAAAARHPVRGRVIGLAITAAVVAVGAGLVFAANSSDPARHDAAENRSQVTPSTTTSAAPSLTPRGNIPKEVGELAGFGSADAPDQNTFTIEEILVDPPCAAGGGRPDGEHTILLDVTVRTGVDTKRAEMLGRILTPGFFAAIGPDGTEHDAWPGECTDPADALRDDFGPNSEYSGTVELRVPVRSGTLILNGVMTNAAGWEWRF